MVNLMLSVVCIIQCSKTCGRGARTRDSYCMNNLGRRLVDSECSDYQRMVAESCNDQACPDWSANDWSEVRVTLHTHKHAHTHSTHTQLHTHSANTHMHTHDTNSHCYIHINKHFYKHT
jgi:hypothetical protein